MMTLLRKLQKAAIAHEKARIFVDDLAESTERFVRILAELDAEIKRQRAYLENRHIATVTDLALMSLKERRSNIARSLETLRKHAPVAEKALSAAELQLNEIRRFNSGGLG